MRILGVTISPNGLEFVFMVGSKAGISLNKKVIRGNGH